MRTTLLALTLALVVVPAWADTTTTTTTSTTTACGPQEVGTTTMPAGQYFITEQISHKSYSLTVTDKGNMILGPAPDGVVVTNATATTTTTTTTAAVPKTTSDKLEGLMKQGAEKGMTEMVKQGATKELGSFLK